MNEVRNPHVAWVVGGGAAQRDLRKGARRRMPRSVTPEMKTLLQGEEASSVADVHAQRRPRRWVVIDPDEEGEQGSEASTSSDEEGTPAWAAGGRRWHAAGYGTAVRQDVEEVDQLDRLRQALLLLLLAVPAGIASLVASVIVVIGHDWPYYVLAGGIVLFTLAIEVGLAFMVRTPWKGSGLERRILASGETPTVLFQVRRLLNSGWGAATEEALWFWNRAHRFLWKRPPTRIHFSAVRGYRAVPRGSRTTLLLLVYLVRGTPQVPAMTWGVHRGGRLELLRLNLPREKAERVIATLAQYGVQPLPSLHWSSVWGVPPNRRNALSTLSGGIIAEALIQFLLRGFSPIDVAVASLPMVGLVAAGVRRLVHGQMTGAILFTSGIGALLSLARLYHTDALTWRLAFVGTLSLAGVSMIADARRGMVGWVPHLFRLLWAAWLLLGLALVILI